MQPPIQDKLTPNSESDLPFVFSHPFPSACANKRPLALHALHPAGPFMTFLPFFSYSIIWFFFFSWGWIGGWCAIRFLHGSQKWHNLYRCQGIRTPRPLCCGLYGGWLRAGLGWMSLYFSIRRGLGSHRSAAELWGNVYRAGPGVKREM